MRLIRRLLGLAVIAALGGVAVLAVSPAAATRAGSLRVVFFDVGQGDAALVISPTGRRVLIDAGPAGSHVGTRLREMGIDTLDLVVASHNHADHIGGMAEVIEQVAVRRYIDNGLSAPTQTYGRVVAALERHAVVVLEPSPRSIQIGDSATIRVLPSSARGTTQNDRSVGVVLTYGAFSALFTGDAEDLQRGFWIDSAGLTRIGLLKVSHHGSINGTDGRLMQLIRPCVAIISVGARNAFGHPAAEVIALLQSAVTRVYRTDVDGEITAVGAADGAVTINSGRRDRFGSNTTERIACAAPTREAGSSR